MYIIMLYAYIPMIVNQLFIIILLQMKNVLPVTVLSLCGVTKMSVLLLGNKSVLSHVLVAIDGHE